MAGVKSWIRGSLVGAGAFGKVNLAVNRENGELFAVKSIECSSTGACELKAIENEVEILQSLDSPYVVSCLGSDWSVENGKPMRNVFLEYMPGGSLADLMQKFTGKLDEGLIRAYTRSILEGLNYLHSKGIVHCDIKGKNVLVGTSGVKLADFGAAKRIDSAGNAVTMESIKGTPLWMAPEVARQVEQGTASDIWSLGCTVVEMATGRAPWSHLANPLVALYHIGCTDDLPAMPATLSKDGLDFLSKCFQRDAMVRWTAAQLLTHPFIVGQFSAADTPCPAPASPTSVLDLPASLVWDSQTKCDTVVMDSVPILALKRAAFAPVTESTKQQQDFAMGSGTVTEDWWCTSPLSPKEGQWITVRSPKPSSAAAVGMPSPLSDFAAPLLGERVKLGLNFGLPSASRPEQAADVEEVEAISTSDADEEELVPTTTAGVLDAPADAQDIVEASCSGTTAGAQVILQCRDGDSDETTCASSSGSGSFHSQGCILDLDCAISEGGEVAERRGWIRNFSRNSVSLVLRFTRLTTDSQNCFFNTKLLQHSRMCESLGSRPVPPGQVALCILLLFSKHRPPWLFKNLRLLVCLQHWSPVLLLSVKFVLLHSVGCEGRDFLLCFFANLDAGSFRESSILLLVNG